MSTNFSLSLELIFLMNWLLENEKEGIQELIKKAIKNGFSEQLSIIDGLENEALSETNEDSQKLHNAIFDFLIFLEDTLIDSLELQEGNNQTEDVSPTIRQLTVQGVDSQEVWKSLYQIKDKLIKKDKKSRNLKIKAEETKKVLLSQLLKNWNPKTKDLVN